MEQLEEQHMAKNQKVFNQQSLYTYIKQEPDKQYMSSFQQQTPLLPSLTQAGAVIFKHKRNVGQWEQHTTAQCVPPFIKQQHVEVPANNQSREWQSWPNDTPKRMCIKQEPVELPMSQINRMVNLPLAQMSKVNDISEHMMVVAAPDGAVGCGGVVQAHHPNDMCLMQQADTLDNQQQEQPSRDDGHQRITLLPCIQSLACDPVAAVAAPERLDQAAKAVQGTNNNPVAAPEGGGTFPLSTQAVDVMLSDPSSHDEQTSMQPGAPVQALSPAPPQQPSISSASCQSLTIQQLQDALLQEDPKLTRKNVSRKLSVLKQWGNFSSAGANIADILRSSPDQLIQHYQNALRCRKMLLTSLKGTRGSLLHCLKLRQVRELYMCSTCAVDSGTSSSRSTSGCSCPDRCSNGQKELRLLQEKLHDAFQAVITDASLSAAAAYRGEDSAADSSEEEAELQQVEAWQYSTVNIISPGVSVPRRHRTCCTCADCRSMRRHLELATVVTMGAASMAGVLTNTDARPPSIEDDRAQQQQQQQQPFHKSATAWQMAKSSGPGSSSMSRGLAADNKYEEMQPQQLALSEWLQQQEQEGTAQAIAAPQQPKQIAASIVPKATMNRMSTMNVSKSSNQLHTTPERQQQQLGSRLLENSQTSQEQLLGATYPAAQGEQRPTGLQTSLHLEDCMMGCGPQLTAPGLEPAVVSLNGNINTEGSASRDAARCPPALLWHPASAQAPWQRSASTIYPGATNSTPLTNRGQAGTMIISSTDTSTDDCHHDAVHGFSTCGLSEQCLSGIADVLETTPELQYEQETFLSYLSCQLLTFTEPQLRVLVLVLQQVLSLPANRRLQLVECIRQPPPAQPCAASEQANNPSCHTLLDLLLECWVKETVEFSGNSTISAASTSRGGPNAQNTHAVCPLLWQLLVSCCQYGPEETGSLSSGLASTEVQGGPLVQLAAVLVAGASLVLLWWPQRQDVRTKRACHTQLLRLFLSRQATRFSATAPISLGQLQGLIKQAHVEFTRGKHLMGV